VLQGGAMGSSEEEAASDGSDGFSDEDGSGTPEAPAWTARATTSRSGRRLRGAAAAAAQGRVASAPNLRGATASASPPQPQQQRQQEASPAAPAGQSGFVALPGGGLQLQFGAPPPSAVALFNQAAAPAQQIPNSGGGSMLSGQPLLVRVGSETHLIPHQLQQPQAPPQHDQRMTAGLGASSTLGKRMTRIQSEPAFTYSECAAPATSHLRVWCAACAAPAVHTAAVLPMLTLHPALPSLLLLC
jgi:hypothetical protein